MSQENVEAVRSIYRAWTEGDLEALLASADPSIELLTSGAFPDTEPIYRGHNGIRAFWESMLGPWQSFQLEPERIVEGNDCVVVAVRFRARGKDSGVVTELSQGHAYRLKDGRIVEVSTHMSFDEALEVAGLSE